MLFDPQTAETLTQALNALMALMAVYHIVLSVAVAVVAHGRGRSGPLWFLLAFGLTFFPAVLLLIAAGGARRATQTP